MVSSTRKAYSFDNDFVLGVICLSPPLQNENSSVIKYDFTFVSCTKNFTFCID